jgi:hypothetical protein
MVALSGLLSGTGRGAERELESRRAAGRLAVQLDAQQTMQTQRLGAQRDMQMEQIEARAEMQKQAADTAYKRTALAAGLQGKLKEQQLDNELTKLQETARLEAEQFEYEFTTKQRQEIAKFNEARQRIGRDPNFSEDERAAATRAIDLQQAGIHPSLMPRDPNKPTFAEGREPGAAWKDPEITPGATFQTKIGSNGQPEVGLLVRPDQTPEYKEMEIQAEREKAMVLRRQKWEDERRRYEIELDKLEVPIVEEAKEGGWLGIGAEEGGPTGLKRLLTESEKQERIRRHFGAPPPTPGEGQGPSDIELEEELQRRVDTQEPWWMGTKATDAEKQLPPMPGRASMYIREAIKEYKGIKNMPPEVQAAFRQASQILIQHHQKLTGQ